ncbi:MAG TPA: Dyp-type peroxidase [Hydrogenophaga sp.]
MPAATLAQPGILETIPAQARYLAFQHSPGTDPRPSLQALATQADGASCVVGLGPSLIGELGAQVPGLHPYRGIEGAQVKLPATPVDLLIWVRGTDRGELLLRSQALQASLEEAFELESVTDAFNHAGGKDLTGYEDGTENPEGEAAHAAALVTSGAPSLHGSSFLALMRWRHHLSRFDAMPSQQQDHIFGRERESNEEIDDAPESAHVKRTAQENFEPQAFVLRRSMPWAEGNQGGLMFAAFGCSLSAFEAQLRRMSGAEDGIVDALFSFTEPQSGAYFWCPPMREDKLNLSAIGL